MDTHTVSMASGRAPGDGSTLFSSKHRVKKGCSPASTVLKNYNDQEDVGALNYKIGKNR